MLNMIKGTLAALVVVSWLPFTAMAALITDVNLSDLNTIISQNSYAGGADVSEEFKEVGVFDKVISFNPAVEGLSSHNVGPYGPANYRLSFNFNILNSTPYVWDAFAFELWDSSFNQRLNYAYGFIPYGEQEIFGYRTTFGYGSLSFAAFQGPDPGYQDPGEYNNFHLDISINEAFTSFGLRQIVGIDQNQITTIPLPPSVWLLGSGLLCLAGWRRCRKA